MLAKLKAWALGLLAFLAAIGAAVLYGRSKGRQAEQVNTRVAQDAAATAQATTEQLESRHETDAQVQRLPDAPAQAVGHADPGTAAGRLQDWTRD